MQTPVNSAVGTQTQSRQIDEPQCRFATVASQGARVTVSTRGPDGSMVSRDVSEHELTRQAHTGTEALLDLLGSPGPVTVEQLSNADADLVVAYRHGSDWKVGCLAAVIKRTREQLEAIDDRLPGAIRTAGPCCLMLGSLQEVIREVLNRPATASALALAPAARRTPEEV